MSTIAQFELLLAISVSLVAVSVVLPILITILQLRHEKEAPWWLASVWFASAIVFMSGLGISAYVQDLWDAPGAYTRQVGLPQMVRIEHMDFLPGTLGYSSVVRVDTDQAIYFLDGYTPIPAAGTVYAVERRKFWGNDTQAFLCLNASLNLCWPILTNLGWPL
ncbi:MAG TPA: hypothetical protein VNI53_04885 [Gammaproteobacteria bacterium]|nr:hypothetical protein [Gammaproteobacteria bacterium]